MIDGQQVLVVGSTEIVISQSRDDPAKGTFLYRLLKKPVVLIEHKMVECETSGSQLSRFCAPNLTVYPSLTSCTLASSNHDRMIRCSRSFMYRAVVVGCKIDGSLSHITQVYDILLPRSPVHGFSPVCLLLL